MDMGLSSTHRSQKSENFERRTNVLLVLVVDNKKNRITQAYPLNAYVGG